MNLDVIAAVVATHRAQRPAARRGCRHRIVVGKDVVDLVVASAPRGWQATNVRITGTTATTAFVLVLFDEVVRNRRIRDGRLLRRTEVNECAVPGIA